MLDDQIKEYQQIRKAVAKARAIRIFVYHLLAYVLGNTFLGAWNIFTYQNLGDNTLWVFSSLIFWDVGVIIHYLQSVALFDEWWDNDDQITDLRFMEMRSPLPIAKPVHAGRDEDRQEVPEKQA